MSKTRKAATATMPVAGLPVAIAYAQAAAERASAIAASAGEWSSYARIPMDDAGEASRAAMRARLAAEKVVGAKTEEEAWDLARLAWAAEASTTEASERVNVAIAEWMAML